MRIASAGGRGGFRIIYFAVNVLPQSENKRIQMINNKLLSFFDNYLLTNGKHNDNIHSKKTFERKDAVMSDRKPSAIISLALCALSSVLLTVWLFTFPVFFRWLLTACHGAADGTVAGMTIVRFVSIRFYLCSPFAALALYMLIRMLLNMIAGRVFIKANVTYLRFISRCCYLVALITAEGGRNYFPLLFYALSH